MSHIDAWHAVTATPDPDGPNGLRLEIHHTDDCPTSPIFGAPICATATDWRCNKPRRDEWAQIGSPGTYRARVTLAEGGAFERLEIEPTDPGDVPTAVPADADGVA